VLAGQVRSRCHIDRLDYLVRCGVEILVSALLYVRPALRVSGNVEEKCRALARRQEFDAFVADLAVAAAEEGGLRPGVDPTLTAKLVFGTVYSQIEWYRPCAGGSVRDLPTR